MPMPHIFRRSARAGRRAYHEPANPQTTARLISAQLGHMIDKAEAAGLARLRDLLEAARIEGEQVTAGQTRLRGAPEHDNDKDG